MRSILVAFQLSILLSASISAHPSDILPFILAIDGTSTLYTHNDTSSPSNASSNPLDLLKRQNCPANYFYCSTIIQSAACCSTDAVCSLDNAGNPACCPIGSYCTGTIPVGSKPSSTAVFVTTTSSGVVIVSTTTTAAPATTTAAATITYVANPYFPYPYIATSFANSAACASAYSSCANNFAICTADLAGGGNGGYAVTVSGPNGGVTVSPTAAMSLGTAIANAVCSSLSSVACSGNSGTCSVYGTAAATTTFVVGSGAGRIFGSLEWSLGFWGFVIGVVGIVSVVL